MSKAKLTFTPLTEEQEAAKQAELDEAMEAYCQCPWAGMPCTLIIEEGQATIKHDECGKLLDLYPEDIFTEFKVVVTVETCENPGGWHGMTRCECGPTIIIEHDKVGEDEEA